MRIDPASPAAVIEIRRPPRNALALGGGLQAWLFGRIQLFADLQVASASRDAKEWLQQRQGSVLEVGCGEQPYLQFVPKDCRYVGIDHAQSNDFSMERRPNVIYYSGTEFPVGTGHFDSLFHTEVLEHVFETTVFLRECHRVLRPAGEMFFTVPFQARYHFKPHDYFRFTPAALHRLLAEHGFEAVRVAARGTDITIACYKAAAVAFRWAYGGSIGKALFLLTAPLTVVALLVAHIATALKLGSDDDCLGYSVTARKRGA